VSAPRPSAQRGRRVRLTELERARRPPTPAPCAPQGADAALPHWRNQIFGSTPWDGQSTVSLNPAFAGNEPVLPIVWPLKIAPIHGLQAPL
jgi:hypothetical protein